MRWCSGGFFLLWRRWLFCAPKSPVCTVFKDFQKLLFKWQSFHNHNDLCYMQVSATCKKKETDTLRCRTNLLWAARCIAEERKKKVRLAQLRAYRWNNAGNALRYSFSGGGEPQDRGQSQNDSCNFATRRKKKKRGF